MDVKLMYYHDKKHSLHQKIGHCKFVQTNKSNVYENFWHPCDLQPCPPPPPTMRDDPQRRRNVIENWILIPHKFHGQFTKKIAKVLKKSYLWCTLEETDIFLLYLQNSSFFHMFFYIWLIAFLILYITILIVNIIYHLYFH